MRFPGLFRRNDRWVRQVDAHVDGRLTPIERELLQDRMDESEEVKAAFEETRQLKRALRSLPEHPAPRSFAITPEMLEEAKPVRPAPRSGRLAMRVSQATAFAAMLGFGVLVAVDVTGGNGAVSSQIANEEAASMEALSTLESDTAGGAESDEGRTTQASDGPPLGAGDASPPDANLEGDDVTSAGEGGDAGAGDAGTNGGSEEPISTLEAPTETGERNFLPAYIGLAAVAVAALGTWLASALRLRHRENAV